MRALFTPEAKQRYSEAEVGAQPGAGGRHRHRDGLHHRRAGVRARRRRAGAGPGEHPRLRRRPRRRGRAGDRRARGVDPGPRLPRPARRRGARRARPSCPAGRRSSRATARCWRAAPPARAARPREPAARSPAALGRPDTAQGRRSARERGLPPPRRGGHDRPGARLRARAGRAAPAASCWPATACWPAPSPSAGKAVRTTIDSRLQLAAVAALGARFGGVAALDARNGEVRALAGRGLLGAPAPGLDLQDHHHHRRARGRQAAAPRYPVQTAATIDGTQLENANGESCGGTFRETFAHSCNSVFAPLGVKVGAERLVETAERYGWNAQAGRGRRAAAPPSRPPTRSRRRSSWAPSAIGQGKVLATPFRMASVAQTIAGGGVMTEPSLKAGAASPRRRVTSEEVARAIRTYMLDVVRYGTGTAAAIPGVAGGGQDRHRRAGRHPRAQRPGQRPLEHRRLVHGLRPRPQAAAGRGRAAGQGRRGRGDRGAGGQGGPAGRPEALAG